MASLRWNAGSPSGSMATRVRDCGIGVGGDGKLRKEMENKIL